MTNKYYTRSRVAFILFVVISFSHCTCDDSSNNGPNNRMSDTSDVTTRNDMNEDGSTPDVSVADRTLVERIPLVDAVGNRVEDPEFSLQSGGWFIRDGNNQSERVQRRYHWDSPEDRPFISILPNTNAPVCAIGRVKFGAGEHEFKLWVSSETDDVTVSFIAVSGDDYVSQSVPVVGDTIDFSGHPWRTLSGSAGPFYGWGFLQICSRSSAPVFVGAPLVRELAPLNNARINIVQTSEQLPITAKDRLRIQSLPSQVDRRQSAPSEH